MRRLRGIEAGFTVGDEFGGTGVGEENGAAVVVERRGG
jgi:hypothetical protein